MPGRKVPLVTGEIYHVFNRGIDKRPTFTQDAEYIRAIEAIIFYRLIGQPCPLSKFLCLDAQKQAELRLALNGKISISLIAYCLMPNHFHLLIRQEVDGGISKYLSNFQNSYTKYFNAVHERNGPLFLNQFKAVRIESEEQLLHVSRYIHLNPYSSHMIDSIRKLPDYPWSSFKDYVDESVNNEISRNLVLDYYGISGSYKEFVLARANYQKQLKEMEHLLMD